MLVSKILQFNMTNLRNELEIFGQNKIDEEIELIKEQIK